MSNEFKLVPDAWQFLSDGKWHNGDDRIKDHRKNIEEAGYPTRDLYAAAPQPPALDDDLERGMDLGMFLAEMKNVKAERDQLKARCDAQSALLENYFNNPNICAYKASDIEEALSKPTGSEK